MQAKTPAGGKRRPDPQPFGYLDRLERRIDDFMTRSWGYQAILLAAGVVLAVLVLFSPVPLPHPHVRGVVKPFERITALAPGHHAMQPAVSQPAAPVACPSLSSVEAGVGVPLTGFGEACGFHWQGSAARVRCPGGFLCTFELADKIVVITGTNQVVDIVHAGTWRYAAAYPGDAPAHSACTLLAYERAVAPQYTGSTPVEAQGFHCSS
ncbi:MAG TPA: hypothetical protein VFI42_16330 [Thermomicrobiaceae bacterium]|nr:hypothetical protein [Thermomicrobiaceae bacterium]